MPRSAVLYATKTRRGVRLLLAHCPEGTTVVHGGGSPREPLSPYLGHRHAHCPCCSTYYLTIPPDWPLPRALRGTETPS